MIRIACRQQGPLWKQLKDDPTLLSATDVVSALGLNDYTSRKRLFEIRTGESAPANLDGNPAVERGRQLEPTAIRFIVPRLVSDHWLPFQPGSVLAWDPDVPLTCSPDVLLIRRDGVGVRGVEVKVPFFSPPPPWPRPAHVAQVMASLLVTGADRWWLHYYWDAEPALSETFVIRPNEEAFEMIRAEAVQFLDEVDRGDRTAGRRSVPTFKKDHAKDILGKTVVRLNGAIHRV